MNYSKEELVSVIMPTYNSDSFIGIALDSLINQSYVNWEVIVIDDCSNDNTEYIVKEYMKRDNRIRYYRLEINSGAAIARNKAIDLAEGQYIAFLDSDDVWFPEKLTDQIRFMKKNDYNFTCTSYKKIDEHGLSLEKTVVAETKSNYNDILKKCPGNSTIVYKAEKLGKFKIPDIKKRNDYVMWLKVIKKAGVLYGMTEPLSCHRVRKGSLSKEKSSLIKYHWKVYRKYEELSLIKSVYLIIYWSTKKILRLR